MLMGTINRMKWNGRKVVNLVLVLGLMVFSYQWGTAMQSPVNKANSEEKQKLYMSAFDAGTSYGKTLGHMECGSDYSKSR